MKSSLKSLVRRAGLKREHVAAWRMFGERNLLAAVRRPVPREGGRVLCYHSFGQPMLGVNDVRPERFRRQIEAALRDGFRFVAPGEIARNGGGPKDLAITFDDGWKTVMTAAAPMLKDYDIRSTLFVVSGWCDACPPGLEGAVLGWRDLEQLMAAGVEIGSHSVSHSDFGLIDRDQVVSELEQSRDAIRLNLGVRPRAFAIPFGQSANWSDFATAAARAAGYESIYAQAEATRPEGTVSRTFITRFDDDRIFRAALGGAFDRWEEWV
jgi:peptidoglycan/xylan/chitin deacetylase (PgdA/CDA1 family)